MSGGGGGAPASVVRPSPSLVRLSVNDDVRGSAKDLSETELTVLNLLRELLANGANEGRAGWYSDDGDGDGDGDGDDARMLSLCSMMSQLNTFSGGTSKADDNVFRVALGAFGLKVEDLPPDTKKAQVRLAPYPSYRALFFSLCSAFGRPDDVIWTTDMEYTTGVLGHGHPATALRRKDVRKADLEFFVALWWGHRPQHVDEKNTCTEWSGVPWNVFYEPVGTNDRYVANTPRRRWVAVLKLLQLRGADFSPMMLSPERGADFSSMMLSPERLRKDRQLHRLFFECRGQEVYNDEEKRKEQVDAITKEIDEGARCGRPETWHGRNADPALWYAHTDSRQSILQLALSVQHDASWPELLDVVLAEGDRYGGAHIFEDEYVALKDDLGLIVYALGYVPQPEDRSILPDFLFDVVNELDEDDGDGEDAVGPSIVHADEGKTYDAIHRVLKAYLVHYDEVVKKPPFGMPPCDDRPFYVSTHLEELIQKMRVMCAQLQAAVERLPDLDGATEGLRDATGKLDAAIDDTLLTHKDALERVRRRMGFSPPYYVPTSPAYDPCFPDYDRQPSEQDPWDVRDSRPSEASSSQQQQGQGQGQWEWP